MTDDDRKRVLDIYTEFGNENIQKFIKAISNTLSPGEIWGLNTAGYHVVSRRILTTSKKKQDHPHLHYGTIFTDNNTLYVNCYKERVDAIDNAIDQYLLSTNPDTGEPNFWMPINSIRKGVPNSSKYAIGYYIYRYADYTYVIHKHRLITDGIVDIISEDLCATDEAKLYTVKITDYQYIMYIYFSKDNKDCYLNTNVDISLI